MEQFWSFFSFPLNLLLATIWAMLWYRLWKSRPGCAAVRFLLSPTATICAIAVLLASCLWLGFSNGSSFVRSIFFAAILLYVQTVVFLVMLRGWRRACGQIRWRFLLIHAGLLLVVSAGFWGAPDTCELRTKVAPGQVADTAFRLDGSITGLGYELELVEVHSFHEASIAVEGAEPVRISVNHPYCVKPGEEVFLASVSDGYCILQIVREPWKYVTVAGILMLIAGAFLLFIKGPGK